jgi:hypothetical protein
MYFAVEKKKIFNVHKNTALATTIILSTTNKEEDLNDTIQQYS